MVANDDRTSPSPTEPTGVPGTDELMSAWPPLVALGLVVAELGIVLNLVPVSIGGVVLFGASVAGILTDADMIRTPWYAASVLGVVFVLLGIGLVWTQLSAVTPGHVLAVATGDPIAIRGSAVALGGLVLVGGGILGIAREPRRTHP